jgi:hypothetical protein
VAGGETSSWYLVDGLLVFSHGLDETTEIKAQMTCGFEMNDFREVDRFLGMEIEYDRKQRLISLGQTNYVSKILDQFGMDESHAVTTPVATEIRLETTIDTDKHFDTMISQSAIGSLMYAMLRTRPDIAYAIYLFIYLISFSVRQP